MRYVVILAALAAACGSDRKQIERDRQRFECRQRSASYTAVKHISGDEIGVLIDCAEAGPRIKRWKSDKQGTRQEDVRNITPGAFDTAWKEIEGTGWPYLKDCANGSLEKR